MKSLYESIIGNTNIGRWAIGNRLEEDGYKCTVIYNDGKTAYLLSDELRWCNGKFKTVKSTNNESWFDDTNIASILHFYKNALDFKDGWHIPGNKDRKLLDSKQFKENIKILSDKKIIFDDNSYGNRLWTLIRNSHTSNEVVSIYYSLNYGLVAASSYTVAQLRLLKKIDL